MTEKPTAPEAEQPTPGASGSEKQNDFATLPEWAQQEIRDMRRENAGHRQKKLEAEQATRTAEDARLADQQKWQELAEKRARDLDGLKPIQERVTALEAAFTSALQKRLDAIPEQYKSLVPDFPDPVQTWGWLDKNQSLFAARIAPKLDAGAQGNTSGANARQLTPDELQMAKNSGMTGDQYLAALLKVEQRKS